MTANPPHSSIKNPFPGDLGPLPGTDGVLYRVWAFCRKTVVAHIEKKDGQKYTVPLEPAGNGYFLGLDSQGAPGDLYRFSLDGAEPVADFASHYQPQGVDGPSMVVDAASFPWRATSWQRPAFNGQVIYECHIGTLTREGTFLAAIEKLDHLVALGVTALEIMPVADWAGRRGWGYDGVLLFAPYHGYGTPDDFRTLIDACHLRGLAVILDVVFNHLGPAGNHSHQYSDYYFYQGNDNPWGQNFNLHGDNSQPVRAMLRHNVRYWLDEFRIDGFRMDATHTVHDPSDVHLLAEAAEIVHSRGGFIIAEDDRNARSVLDPKDKNGWHFDALWSDDFHHVMRVSQTGDQRYFYSMFQGSADEVVQTLQHGWLYSGQVSPFHQKPRGTVADDFPPQSFVYCISNHDQVGNRLRGDRFHQVITPAAYRSVSLFLCLVPETPMIFMGQEWGANTPFYYFTDMPGDLGRLIREGRRREFLQTKFATEEKIDEMLDPQAEETFLRSKLDWTEPERPEHAKILNLYRSGLKMRRELFRGVNPSRDQWKVEAQERAVVIRYQIGGRLVSVYHHLAGPSRVPPGKIILRSEAPEFGGENDSSQPETLVVEE
jgi:maltooligosyltrehalose trehalohydrolase